MEAQRQDVEPEAEHSGVSKMMRVLVGDFQNPERKNEELAAQIVALKKQAAENAAVKKQEKVRVAAESSALMELAAQVSDLKKLLREKAAEHRALKEQLSEKVVQTSEVHTDLKQQLFDATSELWRSREERETLKRQLHSTTSQLCRIRREMTEMRTVETGSPAQTDLEKELESLKRMLSKREKDISSLCADLQHQETQREENTELKVQEEEQVSERTAEYATVVFLRTKLNSTNSQLSLVREKVHYMRKAMEARSSKEAELELELEDLKGMVRGKEEVISSLRADLLLQQQENRREEEWKERYEDLQRSCREKMSAAQEESQKKESRLDRDVQRLFLENKELQKLACTSKAYKEIMRQEQKELRRKRKWENKWHVEKEKKKKKELEEKMKWEKELKAEREKRERQALREHERRERREREQREGTKTGFATFFFKWRSST